MWLWRIPETGTEGARQRVLLNLSGKRTEWVNFEHDQFAPIFSPEHLAFGVFSLQKTNKKR